MVLGRLRAFHDSAYGLIDGTIFWGLFNVLDAYEDFVSVSS